jgi:iron complex outermembrane receptor protein
MDTHNAAIAAACNDSGRDMPIVKQRKWKAASVAALTALLICSLAKQTLAEEQQLPEVVVEGAEIISASPSTAILDIHRTDLPPAADGAEFLRSVPGVTAGRMGGHGLELMIRGQQQNQLNVIGDGAFAFGACPGRMDPPTSLTAFDTYDNVTVEKGYQTVTRGPGGSGGAVLFERTAPKVTSGKPYDVKVTAGWESNGNIRDLVTNFAGGAEAGYGRFIGVYKNANDYEDGNGNSVRSAFREKSGNVELGWTPTDSAEFSLSFEHSEVADALFAGSGMDTPETKNQTTRLKFNQDLEHDIFKRVEFSAYRSFIDHLMDNFSLRTSTMLMKTEAISETYGGRLAVNLAAASNPLVVGADIQVNNRDADKFRGNTLTTLASYMWPGAKLRQIGMFGEGTADFGGKGRLKAGLRYDHVDFSLDKADLPTSPSGMMTQTPNDLYRMYYGTGAEKTVDEHNVSGLLRYEYDVTSDATVFAGASRSVRTADATERAMASGSMTASNRWIGNPYLDPEKHHQVDLGLSVARSNWGVDGSVYYDRVEDYILRDRAHGASGILLADLATVYRNVSATLAGGEIAAHYRFLDDWRVDSEIALTYGENETDGRPLAQIPPLSGSFGLVYQPEGWSVGGRLDMAAKQTRVDNNMDGTGRDVGETPGYAVLDLYASVDILQPFELRVGINNVFDKTYANHINKSNSFDVDEVQVNEPGRSFFMRVSAAL